MPIDAVNIKGGISDSAATLGSYLGREHRICCGNENDQQRPAIVYNRYHNEYLVVNYQVDNVGGHIGGARVGLDGWAYSNFLLSTTSDYDCCSYPDVAYNWTDDEYLVVWQQFNNSQNKWEIYGRFIPWDGPKYPNAATPFLIAQWSSMNLMYPKVAWNSYRN